MQPPEMDPQKAEQDAASTSVVSDLQNEGDAPLTIPPPDDDATTRSKTPVASYLHTAIVLLIMLAVVALGAIRMGKADAASNAGPLGTYVSTVIWQWGMFGFIAWGLYRNGHRVRELLGRRWRAVDDVLVDVLVAAGFWIAAVLVLAILRYLFTPMPNPIHATPQQTQQAVDSALKGIKPLIPRNPFEYGAWVLTALTAGIVEEFIFRGYLQRQFTSMTKNAAAGIAISALLFGGAHLYQGYTQMALIAVYGAMFGVLAWWRGSIKPGMMAHAWQDTLSMLLAGLLSSGRLHG